MSYLHHEQITRDAFLLPCAFLKILGVLLSLKRLRSLLNINTVISLGTDKSPSPVASGERNQYPLILFCFRLYVRFLFFILILCDPHNAMRSEPLGAPYKLIYNKTQVNNDLAPWDLLTGHKEAMCTRFIF